jgi:hypothetical protein
MHNQSQYGLLRMGGGEEKQVIFTNNFCKSVKVSIDFVHLKLSTSIPVILGADSR